MCAFPFSSSPVRLFSSKRASFITLNTTPHLVYVHAEAISFHLPKPVMEVCFFFHKENAPLSNISPDLFFWAKNGMNILFPDMEHVESHAKQIIKNKIK